MEHIFAVGILNRYSDTKCSILVFKCCIFRLALSHKLKEKKKMKCFLRLFFRARHSMYTVKVGSFKK